MEQIDKIEILLREYSYLAMGKIREVEILLKSSRLFENIPKQYHDQCVVGLFAISIILVSLMFSLIFKKGSSNKKKQLVSVILIF